MCSLKREENKRRKDCSRSDYLGGMIVKRVRDTEAVEIASMTLESAKFGMVVAKNEAKAKVDLQVKLEVVIKANNEAKLEIARKDNTIAELKNKFGGQHEKRESSKLMIASSPVRPPPSSPIIKFQPSPMTPGFQSAENIQDEMERLKQAQEIFSKEG